MELVAAEPLAGSADAVAAEPFDAFYRANSDRVYRALALTLGNPDLAREAADEAMARAYARWERVRTMENPAGWAYRVGLNWATSWWRKLHRERPPADEERHPSARGPDPVALAARATLDQLPLAQRAVVVCRVLLDMSTAETASALGVAEGTVKSRLARALTALRDGLTEED
ncbi:RNA polymerase sigma factor [Plantactinospora solaniradicis]|uniref:RNA polymerase sigma factor n=1 Tax=Plantactinospora solaniradicis TaxID=1723736 RepID=A0ABW1K1R8_9ACTN